MSIKTTRNIGRDEAIRRILRIDALIRDKDYRELETETLEPNDDLAMLVINATPLNTSEQELSKWTDTMLGDFMDRPLYRHSIFDNYLVVEE